MWRVVRCFVKGESMNPCFENLNRIEFVMTYACTGRCKHCSEGEHTSISAGGHIDGKTAAKAVRELCSRFKIDSIMTFGGEPLLLPDDVCEIHSAALKAGIPKRQIITNGYFSKDSKVIKSVAERLAKSGVNALLLSVDAFHQEHIPIEPVAEFALAAKAAGIPIKSQPAWLVSEQDDNPYNLQTREILAHFAQLGIQPSEGNVIFPEGNALKYLAEYFNAENLPHNPYVEDPCDIRAVCVSPDGSLLGGNINKSGIIDILERYKPPKGESI